MSKRGFELDSREKRNTKQYWRVKEILQIAYWQIDTGQTIKNVKIIFNTQCNEVLNKVFFNL